MEPWRAGGDCKIMIPPNLLKFASDTLQSNRILSFQHTLHSAKSLCPAVPATSLLRFSPMNLREHLEWRGQGKDRTPYIISLLPAEDSVSTKLVHRRGPRKCYLLGWKDPYPQWFCIFSIRIYFFIFKGVVTYNGVQMRPRTWSESRAQQYQTPPYSQLARAHSLSPTHTPHTHTQKERERERERASERERETERQRQVGMHSLPWPAVAPTTQSWLPDAKLLRFAREG